MMRTYKFSHRSGESLIPKSMQSELCTIVSSYQKELRKYKISSFKEYILPEIKKYGWSGEYYLDKNSKITITSIKDNVGLCIQTGNVSRLYADLLKLQTLYLTGTLIGGIIIVPTGECARHFGTNIANLERAERELAIFKQVITMPLLLIGFSDN